MQIALPSVPKRETAPLNEHDTLDGKYAILQPLGRGSGGVVHEAEHLLLGKRVAVKHLDSGVAPPELTQEQFVHRLRDVIHLDHPNIAAITDLGTEDSRPYIVSDHLRGNGLAREIEGSGTAGISAAGDLILQVLSAVDYALDSGVLHGALHPGNVLVVYPRPGVPWVKVTDFGLCQATWRSTSERAGPATTSSYLAPEVLAGGRPSAPADVYSTGALLYALLHGEPPTASNRAAETGGTRVPKDLALAISGALSLDPEARPSALEFAQQLTQVTRLGLPVPRGLSIPPSIRWVESQETTSGSLRIYGRPPQSAPASTPQTGRPSKSPSYGSLTESLLRNPRFPQPARTSWSRRVRALKARWRHSPNTAAAWVFALVSVAAGIGFTLLASWLK